MKKLLFSVVALSIAFYACKKSDKSSPATPPIDPANAQLLSDSVKVNHFKASTKGALPAPVGSLVYLGHSNSDTITAVGGRYALIQAVFGESNPANGYYVQIAGADSYFTIDLNQPTNARKRAPHGLAMARTQVTSFDSIIGLKLPANIANGYFKVRFEAYDSLGNVSNLDSVIVKVVKNNAAAADFKTILGKWKFQGYGRFKANGDTDYYNAQQYSADSSVATYSCDENNHLYQTEEGTPHNYRWMQTLENTMTLSGDNSARYVYSVKQRYLDTDHSHCDSLVYTNNDDMEDETDGFYYDTTTKQFYYISDNPAYGNGFDIFVEKVSVLSDKTLTMTYPSDDETGFETYTK